MVALNLYYQHGFTTLDQLPKSGEEYLGLNIKIIEGSQLIKPGYHVPSSANWYF